MNQYYDLERGTFQTGYADQVVSYDGMKFIGRNGVRNVTPTDIDGIVQLDNENCLVIFELKHSGNVPFGQGSALSKIADAVEKGGTNCIVIVATHNTPYPETIIAKDAKVVWIYFKGKWNHPSKDGITLYEQINSYIEYLKENKNDS